MELFEFNNITQIINRFKTVLNYGPCFLYNSKPKIFRWYEVFQKEFGYLKKNI